jgi:hypothetical protein
MIDIQTLRDKINSRKFTALLMGWAILAGMLEICYIFLPLLPIYSTFLGGIVALYGLYCGANVWQRKVEIGTQNGNDIGSTGGETPVDRTSDSKNPDSDPKSRLSAAAQTTILAKTTRNGFHED